MKTIWNGLMTAFALYSKIPVPNVECSEKNMKYTLCFGPLVGAVIGGILYGWNVGWPYLCNYTFLPAVVFVMVPVIISGGVHIDGFINTVDAICSNKTVEGKLEILNDTHTGSFAIIMTFSYFLIALGVWSEMPINAVPILAVGFVLSRALSGLAIVLFPHANTSRGVAEFSKSTHKRTVGIVLLLYVIACIVLMCRQDLLYGGLGAAGAIISFVYYYFMSKKHFGGLTKDVAGYFVLVCELVIPCVVLVAWKFL